MIQRRVVFAGLLVNVVLGGCSTHTTPDPVHEQPLFMQVDGMGTAQPSPQDVDAYQEQYQPAENGLSTGGWAPVQVDETPQSAAGSEAMARALVATDPSNRLQYLEIAAEHGSGQAHYELAKAYTNGEGRPRDLALAQQHLKAAASLNDPEATRVIGWQMIKGQGGYEQNLNGGVAVMQMGVETSVRTQRELGMLFSNLYSDYKLNDPEIGEAYLVRAFNAGDAPAATALGKLYIQQGRQVEAVAPLAFATERGDPGATKMLDELNGGGVVAQTGEHQLNNDDPSQGEAYYQRAIDIMMHKHGLGDEAKAYALFDLAAGQGHNLARAELAAISGVKQMMDSQRGPGWLDAEKAVLLSKRSGE